MALGVVAVALVALLLLPGQARAQIVHAVDGAHGQAYVDHVSQKALEFTEKTGILVNIMTASGHREQIAVWAAGGALPDAIDIVSDNGLSFFRHSLFVDLRPYFERSSSVHLADFVPIALTAFTAPEDYDFQAGALFAYPSFLHNYNAAINVPLFENAGLVFPNDLGDAWNWETLADYAKKLTVDINSDGRLDRWGLFIPKTYLGWMPFFRHAGNPIYDRDFDPTEAFLNTEAAYDTLQFLVEMTADQYFVWDNWRFNEGYTGISYAASPNYAQQMRERHLTIDYVPYAKGPGGANGSEFQVAGTAIAATSDHPDLVWQWLRYLWGEKENVDEMITRAQRIPALLASTDTFNALASGWAPNAHIILASAGYPGSGLRPIVRDGRILGIVTEWVHQAIDGRVPTSTALTTAQEQLNAVFRELGVR